MKFCLPEGKPRLPAVTQTCPLFKLVWVGHIKLFSRRRLGPSLAVRSLLTVPLHFLLKPLERNKVASSFQTGFREASIWTEIKPKNLWKRRLSPILLSSSFMSSYPHIFHLNEPEVLQEAFTLFYIHSHIKIMTFFSFTFSSLSQCKPGCEETLILEKSTGCFHKTQNNTLLLFWNKTVHVTAFAKIKRCELKQASLCLWKLISLRALNEDTVCFLHTSLSSTNFNSKDTDGSKWCFVKAPLTAFLSLVRKTGIWFVCLQAMNHICYQ